MRFAAGTRRLSELACFGRTYRAAEAVGFGLVDEAVTETQVLTRAAEIAAELAALPAEPLRHTRSQVRGPVLERIAQQSATDSEVYRMWDSPSARQSVEAYVNKTLRAQPPASALTSGRSHPC
jgi:enoyl-CoA hydratase/carnithine racemase